MTTAYERALASVVPYVIDEAIRICEIPAPTFRERDRARYVRDRFEAIGDWDVLQLDRLWNVVAIRRGAPGATRLMVAAHLDTVFPDEATPVVRGRGRLTGRGIGDNAVGLSSLLGVATALQATQP